ncbi:MAG: MBL fold metallo-hydrolase [Gammaproteobacteria bacterium]|nr:MBL fold metallo-hydrolase [Gammaproteobacteria bacterium]
MIFRQLFDPFSSTYTYLLGCDESGEAVVIDPVFEQFARDTALMRELGLRARYVLDTHVHADHVTSAWLMRASLGAEIVLSKRYGVEEVDIAVDQGDVLAFGNCAVTVLATPGHTNGCVTYTTSERDMAFTGDCLMIRGAGRTDFQAGDVHEMWHSIREQIFALPDECLIYPGHDYSGRTVSTVGEEKRFNPRIGGDAREEDFVGYMQNLGLAHPKLIDLAVPANLKSGRPNDDAMPEEITWGPVTPTFAGVPEIQPEWVASHLEEVFVLDVRSAWEFEGDLGHLEGAHLVPLDELRERLGEVPHDLPVVTVCQSGKRSAMATEILLRSGYEKVANVAGGLIQWSRLALPFRE